MTAIASVLAVLAIVSLVAFLIIRIYPARSAIRFEGVFEEVDCVNFAGDNAELVCYFSTSFSYQARADEKLFCRSSVCRLPLSTENLSGDYIPRTGHNIRVSGQYNFFGDLLSYKFEHLPDAEPIKYIPDPFLGPDF